MNNLSCHILLVEDNEDDYLIVRDLLLDIATTAFDLQWVDNGAEARELLSRHHYDACLVDYRLGESTGVELVREFAQSQTSFILLTGNEDYAVDVAAAQAGAADYLIKGHINAPLLERSIRFAIQRKASEAALLQAQSFAQATVDALPDNIAVMDERGTIVTLNAAWRENAASNGFVGAASGVGANYLESCEQSDTEAGHKAAACIREVIRGGEASCFEYACNTPGAPQWFAMSATRFAGGETLHIVVAHQNITERKRAEEALRESEARSSAVIQYALDCIITFTPESKVVEFNPAAEATFGFTRAEALGENLTDLIMPLRFHEAHNRGMVRYLKTSEGPILNRRVEVPARRKDGTEITVELTAAAIKHSQPPLFTAYLRDITERKRAEEALRASEERFQSIVANMPGMVYQFVRHPDGSMKWPFVSEGCREIYEVEPEKFWSDPSWYLEKIHPDDRAEFERSALASEQTLLPWRWEGRYLTAEGKTRWIQGASRPQRLPEGGTLWNGLMMDISARKEAESQRDHFFKMALDMLGIAGLDGYFKRLNPAFAETLGFSEAELLARPFLEFVHPEDQDSTLAAVATLGTGGLVVGFENRYASKDGSWKWLEWKSVAVVEEGLIYAAARDVTERKATEAALLQLRDELEARVAERTSEMERSNATLQLQILERERAEREVRAQARQHGAVADLGRRALLDLDLDTLLNGAAALVSATLEVKACSF